MQIKNAASAATGNRVSEVVKCREHTACSSRETTRKPKWNYRERQLLVAVVIRSLFISNQKHNVIGDKQMFTTTELVTIFNVIEDEIRSLSFKDDNKSYKQASQLGEIRNKIHDIIAERCD